MRKVEENKTKGQEVDVECSRCNCITYHKVLVSVNDYQVSGNHEYSVSLNTEYQIIECQGCKTISFRSESAFSEDYDPQSEYTTKVFLYSKRSERSLSPKNFSKVPKKLFRIYCEVIEAFNNGLIMLCSAGLRATIEGICSDKNITSGKVEIKRKNSQAYKEIKSLQGKIAGLAEKGILTKNNADILHDHRYLGNEALHQLSSPSMDELRFAIEIIEHVLENIYDIPLKAKKLREASKNRKSDIKA